MRALGLEYLRSCFTVTSTLDCIWQILVKYTLFTCFHFNFTVYICSVPIALGIVFHSKRDPKTKFPSKHQILLKYFWRSGTIFNLIKTCIPPKKWEKLSKILSLKKKFPYQKKKWLQYQYIPKLDLGFGSRYWNLVLVAH